MATGRSLHSALSSIMSSMSRSALVEVCKLVDVELARLLRDNSALAKKVSGLEIELSSVRNKSPKLTKSRCTVGVQTDDNVGGRSQVCGSPIIEGIFGNDWCRNLWKDEASSDETEEMLSNPTAEHKDEDDGKGPASCSQQEIVAPEEHGEGIAGGPQLSVSYPMEVSACSRSVKDGDEELTTVDAEEPSEKLRSDENTLTALAIPTQEDDDVQFVEVNAVSLNSRLKTGGENCSVGEDSVDYIQNVEANSSPTTTELDCHLCQRTFLSKSTLTHHMKIHTSNVCIVCKKSFAHKNMLNSHICTPEVSSSTSRRSCHLCGKTFANPSALKIHSVVHTGERPYTCHHCGKSFTQKGNLKCHLRRHTGERSFQCGDCGRIYAEKVSLTRHLMTHIHQEADTGELREETCLQMSVV